MTDHLEPDERTSAPQTLDEIIAAVVGLADTADSYGDFLTGCWLTEAAEKLRHRHDPIPSDPCDCALAGHDVPPGPDHLFDCPAFVEPSASVSLDEPAGDEEGARSVSPISREYLRDLAERGKRWAATTYPSAELARINQPRLTRNEVAALGELLDGVRVSLYGQPFGFDGEDLNCPAASIVQALNETADAIDFACGTKMIGVVHIQGPSGSAIIGAYYADMFRECAKRIQALLPPATPETT